MVSQSRFLGVLLDVTWHYKYTYDLSFNEIKRESIEGYLVLESWQIVSGNIKIVDTQCRGKYCLTLSPLDACLCDG